MMSGKKFNKLQFVAGLLTGIPESQSAGNKLKFVGLFTVSGNGAVSADRHIETFINFISCEKL